MDMKNMKRKRSDSAFKKTTLSQPTAKQETEYPPGPIHINPSWNPTSRTEKPPYSYATIIAHAILSSKERKLTLHDIYIWITENYPFYSNDTQGWQNSIRHNLSLHKAFVKIDRDPNAQNPPRKGCFWTIRKGKEKSFIDNLQKPLNSLKKQHSMSHFLHTKRQSIQLSSRRSSMAKEPVVTPTTETFGTTSFCISESEPIVVSSSSSSLSSSDHSPVMTGSPTYNQLLCNVPESTMSYNVYPDNTELFGDFYQHTPMYACDNYPPSLSPCDAYSTTSSFTDNLMVNMNYGEPHYDQLNHRPLYSDVMADYSDYPMMTMLKHNEYMDSNTDSPVSQYYLQHPNTSSFFHC
ncbi:uncharacterized protein B0P05DRAFT_532070 [Gilbertella persicaria]|uniref:uncharacterized protein n=1 Tax=Gilbertella persicaria TaxID=101096 RepID=UPI00221F935B|nr:uncharacterized protein B0P05DRAFT_532070 [Gilbertella persicaria]KAI8087732.1 hypothetical protein B0P05DRAFT_532070 [Gilbertella persicaria]